MIDSNANKASVGFSGRTQDIARVHHYGLKESFHKRGLQIGYHKRPLLGINDDVRDSVGNILKKIWQTYKYVNPQCCCDG